MLVERLTDSGDVAVAEDPEAALEEAVLDTVALAKEARPDVVIVYQEGRGKGDAISAGCRAATGDIVVLLDADGSTDPAEIPGFVGALLAGADFVKGSRFLQGGSTQDMEWYRRLGNWGFVKLVQLRFGGKFTDLCYGYNAFWRDVLDRLSLEQDDGFEIETSMNVQALRAKLVVKELASNEHRRIYGTSNLRTLPDGWRVLSTIFTVDSRKAPATGANQTRVAAPTSGTTRKAAGS